MSHINAQIVRLYDTVFDRAPDAEGLEFWNNASHTGLGLRDLASFFISAPEFASTYGEPTNRGFVESMYLNVLDRPGEAEGIAFWTNALDAGLADRPQIVVGFSESAEHVQQMGKPPSEPAPPPPPPPAPDPVPKGPGPFFEDRTFLPETKPGPYTLGPGGAAEPKIQYASHDGAVLVGGVGWDQLNALGFRDVTMWGQSGDDHVWGWSGNDVLHGGPGNDVLIGGGGDDTLYGGPGHDNLTGGLGNDAFVVEMINVYQSDTITDFQRGDSVRFIGSEPVGPYAISTGSPDSPLIFDLDMSREHLHMISFQGLTAADEGWVRDSFIFG